MTAIRFVSQVTCTLPNECLVDLTGLTGPVAVYGQAGSGFKRSGSYAYALIDMSGSSNITLANLLIDEDSSVSCDAVAQPDQCQSSIRAFNTNNITIDSMTVLHSKRMGIEISGSSNVTIQNNDIEDSGMFGIWTGMANSSNLIVHNNKFTDVSSNAIFASFLSSGTISGNTFDHNHHKAIFSGPECGGPCPGGQLDLLSSSNLAVAGNLIQNGFIDVNTTKSDTDGIEVQDTISDTTIRNNMITTEKGGGIIVDPGIAVQNVSVTGNSFVDNLLAFYNFAASGVQESNNCVSGSQTGSSLRSLPITLHRTLNSTSVR